MQPVPKQLKRHKDITLLFLKHVQLAARPVTSPEQSIECPQAAELAKDLEKLGPTFTRVARVVLGREDLIPENYLRSLANLRDHLEPEGYLEPEIFENVELIVEDELGKKLSRAFKTFDEQPYAFISVGQLHRATLHNGKEVTVKIQRPQLRQQVVKDLDSLAEIAAFLDERTPLGQRCKFSKMIDRFRVGIMAELDYRREAGTLAEIGRNLTGYSQVEIPVVVDELTSARVLTTHHFAGIKILDLPEPLDEESGGEAAADDLIGSYIQQLVALGVFHSNPHAANHCFTADQSIAICEFGSATRLSSHTRTQLHLLLTGLAERNAARATDGAIQISKQAKNEIDRSILLDQVKSLCENSEFCLGNRLLEIARIFSRSGTGLPSEIINVGKMLINLRAITQKLSTGFDTDSCYQRHLEEFARNREAAVLMFPERLTSVV